MLQVDPGVKDVFYLKLSLLVVWLFVCCILGLFYVIPNWGNTNLNRDFGRLFARVALKILGIRAQLEGLENLEAHQPCVYIINHQSALDVAIFGIIYPKNTLIIGKKELLWVPFFGLFFLASGNIIINRTKSAQAVARLKTAVDAIVKQRASIWIFPEGTRNIKDNELLPFKRGAFHTALQAQVPLVPIVCGSIKHVADWRSKKITRGLVRIRVLPPISTQGSGEGEMDRIVADAHAKMTEAFHSLSS